LKELRRPFSGTFSGSERGTPGLIGSLDRFELSSIVPLPVLGVVAALDRDFNFESDLIGGIFPAID